MTIRRFARPTMLGLLIATSGASALGRTPLPSPTPVTAADCAALVALALPQGRVTAAAPVAAGAFTPPTAATNADAAGVFKALPAFCRATATLRPSADSDIRIEVWLPASGWNGKLQAVGNGGWTGSIPYPAMARALSTGYAAAGTDTGHQGGRASFAIGHPEKLTDFSYRAVHEMTVAAKAIVRAQYGSAPRRAYWNGCSSGGRQGLKEAQRFPGDFDGIVAGASANNWVHQKAANMAVQQVVHRNADSEIPASKYPVLHQAVMQACDRLDGVADGVLEDPRQCRFDPALLTCQSGDGPSCLMAGQVASAKALYAPVRNPRTGEEIFPGLPFGTELNWDVPAGPEPRPTQWDLWAFVVFQNPKWDYKTLDLDKDVARASKMDQTAAVDTNLRPFFSRGGKLLMYHGWADPNIVATNSVNYYEGVVRALGGVNATRDSIRLFMVPGMEHCGGGDGTDTFGMVAALDQWVEQGKAPERIEASRVRNGAVDRTRPLCPYPQVARYTGTGSTDDSKNFVCGPAPSPAATSSTARPSPRAASPSPR